MLKKFMLTIFIIQLIVKRAKNLTFIVAFTLQYAGQNLTSLSK